MAEYIEREAALNEEYYNIFAHPRRRCAPGGARAVDKSQTKSMGGKKLVCVFKLRRSGNDGFWRQGGADGLLPELLRGYAGGTRWLN